MKRKLAAFAGLFGRAGTAITAVLGIHEALFLLGLGGIFYGLRGLWSVYGALTVCGAILLLVAVVSIMFAQRKGD
jgi:inner membrane protein involved in colicin E2 resistance